MSQEAGTLSLGRVSVRRQLSFLDYMAGGCEIQCMVAIDFSGGNSPTNDPASCHYAGKRPSLHRRSGLCGVPMVTSRST